jgi:hypothetical protein
LAAGYNREYALPARPADDAPLTRQATDLPRSTVLMSTAVATERNQTFRGSIEWLRDPKCLEDIADDWRVLERSVNRRTHLSTYDFITTWYRHYAGEYGGLPLIGLARRGARLVGVAPLTVGRGTVGRIPLTRIEFAPSDAPAGEFLVGDEEPDIVAALLDDLIAHASFDIISPRICCDAASSRQSGRRRDTVVRRSAWTRHTAC